MSATIENSGATAIRPFTIPGVPKAELEALRARIADTSLLFVAFGEDHIVPAKASRHNAGHYDASTAIIAFKEFPGRPHFPAPRWEEVADFAASWAIAHALGTGR